MSRILAVLIVSSLPALSFSQIKIGYIDSGRIFQEYKGMESIKKQFDKEQAEWQKTAEAKLRELEELRSELESQRLMLSEEALRKKEEEIKNKQSEYEEFIQQIWGPDGRAAKKNVELTKPIVDKINAVLEKLAEEEGFTMIFDIAEGSIVYAKEGLDLTDLVLEELNREFAPAAELKEVKIAVFKFEESSLLAEQGNYGDKVYDLVYDLIDRSPRFEAIPKVRVDNLLSEMGLEREKSIPLERAIEIAKNLDAKVLLIGEVDREITYTEVKARLVDVESGKVLFEETKRAEGETEEAFQSMIGNLVATIIQKYGG